jgi:GNAT superfamily N-acetyltransferase
VNIRLVVEQDRDSIIDEISKFRDSLAELRGKHPISNKTSAETELNEYLTRKYPIYVAEDEKSGIVGYMVCRIDEDVVWVESIYVDDEFRRKGIASKFYSKAELLAKEIGGTEPYNRIDPNNETMIQFLSKRGYDVLNLIELRRKEPNEELINKVKVGNHEYYQQ